MPTVKLDENGRIMLPADLIARLKMQPGDEFIISEVTSNSILLKKKDLRTILEGVIKEAQNVDLDKLERDVEEEGNRIALEKYRGIIKLDRPVSLEEILDLEEDTWLY